MVCVVLASDMPVSLLFSVVVMYCWDEFSGSCNVDNLPSVL